MESQHQKSGILALVKEKVRLLIENPRQSIAHRMDHLLRVERHADLIRKSYPEANAEILKLAVFLHDVDQPFDDKKNHVSRSADAAERILTGFSFPADRRRLVVQAIKEHSTETLDVNRPSSLEARILFDADKLDGLGPHGILRVFELSRQLGRPVADSIVWYRQKIELALKNLQTPEGRQMAQARLPLVETFLAELECEESVLMSLRALP